MATLGIVNIDELTQDMIKRRFYDLAKRHHPDAHGCSEKFRAVKESYDFLKEHQIDLKQFCPGEVGVMDEEPDEFDLDKEAWFADQMADEKYSSE